jgi:hypothetical protein
MEMMMTTVIDLFGMLTSDLQMNWLNSLFRRCVGIAQVLCPELCIDRDVRLLVWKN